MKNIRLARQGDILFRKINKTEFENKRKEKPYKTHVLAYGEITGHSHALSSMDGVEMYVDTNGDIWMSSTKDVTIEHEEHGTINLPAGEYCVTRQEEYDWAKEEMNKVKD